MRVGVREHLPVEPGQTSGRDLTSPRLDVVVTSGCRENAACGTVVVGRGEVARSPMVEEPMSRWELLTLG